MHHTNTASLNTVLPPDLYARVRRANRKRLRSGQAYVLVWLQQALRAYDNPVLDVAISVGNYYRLPVVVYHGLDDRYPYASDRLHRFILEASLSLEEDCDARNLRFVRYVRRPERRHDQRAVYRLAEHAACVITDDVPAFVARNHVALVAERLQRPLWTVDACCVVPLNSLPADLSAPPGLRAAHKTLRADALAAPIDVVPTVARYSNALDVEHDSLRSSSGRLVLAQLISRCRIDHSLPRVKTHPGGRPAALKRLQHALSAVLPSYRWRRNNPADPNSSSKLSPYLHFGVLGPREIARAVQAVELQAATRWKFLDELITWREFSYYVARHATAPASYANIPQSARDTLAAHSGDARPDLYPLEALVRGETDDAVWNVAQRQFLNDGWMHNNLRMYWVKQILPWCESPQSAWATACYLNDRLSLDGRDPSTYLGMQWGFGRSKRGYRELPVYGWVPPKSDRALRKREGVEAWLAGQLERERPAVDITPIPELYV